MKFFEDLFSDASTIRLILVFVASVIAIIYMFVLFKKTGISYQDFIIFIYRSFCQFYNEVSPYFNYNNDAELIKFKENKWVKEDMEGYFILQNDIYLKIPDEETRIFLGFSPKKVTEISANYFTKFDIYRMSSIKNAKALAFRNPKNIEYYVEVGLKIVPVKDVFSFYFLRNVNENFTKSKFAIIMPNKKHLHPLTVKKRVPCINIEENQFSFDTFKNSFIQSQETWLKPKFNKEATNLTGKIKESIDEQLFQLNYRELLINQIEKLRTQCFKTKNIGFGILNGNLAEADLKDLVTQTNKDLNNYESIVFHIREGVYKNHKTFSYNNESISLLKTHFDSLKELKIESNNPAFSDFSNYLEVITQLLSFNLENILTVKNPYNLLFSGRPYIGKSHGLAHYCSERLENNHPSLIIQSLSCPSNNWGTILHVHLDILKSLSEIELFSFLANWCNKIDLEKSMYIEETEMIELQTQVLICVDGLDEAPNKPEWIDRINNLTSYITKFPQIKFAFTSRPSFIDTYLVSEPDWLKIIHLPDKSDAPFEELKAALFKEYNITVNNSNWIDYYIDNPLSLKLFCEQNNDKVITVSDGIGKSLTELIENKLEALEAEISKKLQNKIKIEDEIVRKFLIAIKDEFLKNAIIDENKIFEIISSDANTKNLIERKIVALLLDLLSSNETLIKSKPSGISNLPTKYAINERSILEYLIAIDVYENFDPKQFPEILRELSGALEMIAIMLYIGKSAFIGEDGYWMGKLDENAVIKLKYKVLSKVDPKNIKPREINLVKSQILN